MSADKKVKFKEGDVLVYASGLLVEKFEVIKIVNGKYYDSRSGTCGKPRYDVYEYQVVYIKSLDSLTSSFYFAPERSDDCSHYQLGREPKLISMINSSRSESGDKIYWMNEYSENVINYKREHASFSIQGKSYSEVFEYDVNGTRIAKLYYSRQLGFVGYLLNNGQLFGLQI